MRDSLRAAREELRRKQEPRNAKFAADKATLERQMEALEEEYARDVVAMEKAAADLETAESVFQSDRQGQGAKSCRKLSSDLGRGVYRNEIERYITTKWEPVPPTSISTYLARLKADGLVTQGCSVLIR